MEAKSPRTTPLAREEILAEALRLIDAEGLDALSMRRLARELGVEAMSLYHHVENKDAILDGVVASIVREMTLPEPLPESWVEQLVELVDAFRRALAAHPNALPVLLGRPLGPPEDAMITPVSVLAAQGFEPDRLVEMYQALMALTFGHAFLSSAQTAPGEPAPVLAEDAFRRSARYLIEGFAAEYDGAREGTE